MRATRRSTNIATVDQSLVQHVASSWFPTALEAWLVANMDRYLETTDEGYRPFDQFDAFDRVMRVYWSENEWGTTVDAQTREAFEDAVYFAVEARVWDEAEDAVREAQSDHYARRDMWRYNGVNPRDYYGT